MSQTYNSLYNRFCDLFEKIEYRRMKLEPDQRSKDIRLNEWYRELDRTLSKMNFFTDDNWSG